MAVDHHADDDEEDAAQYGEEHGEEDGDGAHPFLDLAHWRREGESVTERRGEKQKGGPQGAGARESYV